MSLFGMILVVGILVDDGIVITESIYQEYERGLPPIQAAFVGINKVLPAVISSVLTTVAAFSTFFFIEGRLGDFAPALAFVVIATLVFSLIEAAYILPAHIAHSVGVSAEVRRTRLEAYMDGVMGEPARQALWSVLRSHHAEQDAHHRHRILHHGDHHRLGRCGYHPYHLLPGDRTR